MNSVAGQMPATSQWGASESPAAYSLEMRAGSCPPSPLRRSVPRSTGKEMANDVAGQMPATR